MEQQFVDGVGFGLWNRKVLSIDKKAQLDSQTRDVITP